MDAQLKHYVQSLCVPLGRRLTLCNIIWDTPFYKYMYRISHLLQPQTEIKWHNFFQGSWIMQCPLIVYCLDVPLWTCCVDQGIHLRHSASHKENVGSCTWSWPSTFLATQPAELNTLELPTAWHLTLMKDPPSKTHALIGPGPWNKHCSLLYMVYHKTCVLWVYMSLQNSDTNPTFPHLKWPTAFHKVR